MENNQNLSLRSLSSDEINKIEEFRKSNHTAILSILFSDVVNSTYANEKLGEQSYSKLRHIHDELFKRIMCRDNAGIIIKEIGDSFLCVFAEPSTSVLRAIEFQRAIHSNRDNLTVQDYTLTVKIGIHVGQVAVENSLALDIFGRHVNRAARIEALAHGGQILTSQSLWENASGWLKDNQEEKIGWISYGKTKLKGIEERVEIFGFYPKELGMLPAPQLIRKQKQKRTLFLAAIFISILTISTLAVNKLFLNYNNKKSSYLPTSKKTYFVKIDFSEITKYTQNEVQKSKIDATEINEILLAQIISVLNPDSVITENDLIKSSIRQGKLYVNRNCNDGKYFRDTLGFSGAFFIQIKTDKIEKSDSLTLDSNLSIWTDGMHSTATSSDRYNLKNFKTEFRNWLNDRLLLRRLEFEQGVVLECNDSFVIFQYNKCANLREGATIRYKNYYSGEKGVSIWLKDEIRKLEYLKVTPQFVNELREQEIHFQEYKIEVEDWLLNHNGSYGFDNDLYGKVRELFDSTGKATWTNKGIFPFIKPRKGDKIFLAY